MDFFADEYSIIHDGQTVTARGFQPHFAATHAEASTDGSRGYTYGAYLAKS